MYAPFSGAVKTPKSNNKRYKLLKTRYKLLKNKLLKTGFKVHVFKTVFKSLFSGHQNAIDV